MDDNIVKTTEVLTGTDKNKKKQKLLLIKIRLKLLPACLQHAV